MKIDNIKNNFDQNGHMSFHVAPGLGLPNQLNPVQFAFA